MVGREKISCRQRRSWRIPPHHQSRLIHHSSHRRLGRCGGGTRSVVGVGSAVIVRRGRLHCRRAYLVRPPALTVGVGRAHLDLVLGVRVEVVDERCVVSAPRRRVRSWRVVESRGPVVAERPGRPIRCARLAVAGLVVGGDGLQAGVRCRCPRQAEISRFSADGLRAQPAGRQRRQRRRLRVAIRQAQVQRAGADTRTSRGPRRQV